MQTNNVSLASNNSLRLARVARRAYYQDLAIQHAVALASLKASGNATEADMAYHAAMSVLAMECEDHATIVVTVD